jgi:hypothetical protein
MNLAPDISRLIDPAAINSAQAMLERLRNVSMTPKGAQMLAE